MPYFKWVGVDITGATKKGKNAARSSENLSKFLLQQGIALLQCKSLYSPSFLWPINAKIKSDLFKQKVKLLRAGVLLPNVLTIIAQQSYNPIIHDIFSAIECDIQHGVALDKALKKHTLLHDPIVAVMLAAGHESGNIINAMENVALYFDKQYIFNKNIRAALAMPLLTLLFFVGISLFIFIVIIPRFADMLRSMHQELPPLTRSIIAISDFMSSSLMLYIGILIIVIIFCVYRYCMTVRGKKMWNFIINHVPFIGRAIWQHSMCQTLQALALLVNSGVPLVDSLKIVGDAIGHDRVKSQLIMLHDDVAAGQLLSKAMVSTSVFLPEVIALVHIGQESGTMGHSLEGAALVYTNRVEESLRRFVFFLQPAVIILLGLLVATLIFAVYAPIMQLSSAL